MTEPWILVQMHMANERYQQNIHKGQTWDLRWQVGFQWHRRGIELVLQVPRLFHNAIVSQCDHFLLLHMYMYLLFETSPGWLPGWRGFFLTQFGGGHSGPMYLLFVPYTDLYAAEGISAFQTSFLFWDCPHDNLSPVQARITKSGQGMHLSTVKVPIDLGHD